MKKKLETSYSCWLIINEKNQPLYGDKERNDRKFWVFNAKKDAEDYIIRMENIDKVKKKRYIVRVIIGNSDNFTGNSLSMSFPKLKS